jgi:hypothetical protein
VGEGGEAKGGEAQGDEAGAEEGEGGEAGADEAKGGETKGDEAKGDKAGAEEGEGGEAGAEEGEKTAKAAAAKRVGPKRKTAVVEVSVWQCTRQIFPLACSATAYATDVPL